VSDDTMHLITDPHLSAPDDFYEALIDAHRELSPAESHALNARLVLLLANHIGALEVLEEALDAARGVPEDPTSRTTITTGDTRAA
jgi:Protein of unknown function (DUF2783)